MKTKRKAKKPKQRRVKRRYAFADGEYAEAEADGKITGFRGLGI